jgi:hypothetical protein
MHNSAAAAIVSLVGAFLLLPTNAGAQGRRVVEREPNGSMATATLAAPGDTIVGVLDPICDRDFFALDLSAGTRLRFSPNSIAIDVRTADSAISYTSGEESPPPFVPIVVSGRYYVSNSVRFHEGPPANCAYPTPDQVYSIWLSSEREPLGPGDPTRPALPELAEPVARLGIGRSNEMWAYTARGAVTRINPDGSSAVLVQSFPRDRDQSGGTPYVTDGFGNVLVQGDTGSTSYSFIVWRVTPTRGEVTVFTQQQFYPTRPRIGVAPNGDVWIGPTERMDGRTLPFGPYIWRFSPLGEVLDSVSVTFDPASILSSAVSPAGELYLGGQTGLYRVRNGIVQPIVSADSDDFTGLAFDRDGYLYAAKGGAVANSLHRVTLYDPSLRLVNDTFAHLPFEPARPSYQLVFAPDRSGGSLSRLLALGPWLKFAEVNPAGLRAPGFVFPPLLPIARSGDSTAVAGYPFSAMLSMPGAPGSVHWSLATGQLPPGVTLSQETGALTGVPSSSGAYTFSLRAQSGDRYGYARFTILVAPLTFSVEDAINAVLGGPALSPANAQFLDEQGNKNGVFDVGDVRALLRARGLLRP